MRVSGSASARHTHAFLLAILALRRRSLRKKKNRVRGEEGKKDWRKGEALLDNLVIILPDGYPPADPQSRVPSSPESPFSKVLIGPPGICQHHFLILYLRVGDIYAAYFLSIYGRYLREWIFPEEIIFNKNVQILLRIFISFSTDFEKLNSI